jgi:hypothetical protein
MIATNMTTYNYFTLGDKNGYGQPTISQEPQGTVKMAIYLSSQSAQDNINYLDCNYVGLTMDKSVNDKMVIQYGDEKLKVLYVNTAGRFAQVFLKKQ